MDNLMDSIQPGKPRSTSCGVNSVETGNGAGVVHQFGEEIHSLISVPSSEGGSSFTALLELPPNQAVELLVHSPETAEMSSEKLVGSEPHTPYYHFPPPIFPSDTALIDRASKFSVFAGNSPDPNSVLSNSGSKSLLLLKQEPLDSESNPNSSPAVSNPTSNQKTRKRKENEKKVIGSGKKSKKSANDTSEDEKLPYVHVRARRGQATDSHSLAERARREKINARMKLLQELVPGCNKISGTAMVLDEIINHVQSLQRQVEFLSMRLAAVNPRTDFNFDSLFAAESGSHVESNFQGMVMPSMLPEGQNSGNRSQYQQLWHYEGFHQQPVWGREEDNSSFITPENSLLTYDSSANSASLHPNQLKMELL